MHRAFVALQSSTPLFPKMRLQVFFFIFFYKNGRDHATKSPNSFLLGLPTSRKNASILFSISNSSSNFKVFFLLPTARRSWSTRLLLEHRRIGCPDNSRPGTISRFSLLHTGVLFIKEGGGISASISAISNLRLHILF